MTLRPPLEPIAVVGSGCRFPGGVDSPSSLWDLLQNPRDVSQGIPEDRFSINGYYHRNGAHHGTTNVRRAYLMQQDVRQFDAAFFNISPNEADSMDPQQRMLLETVYEALESGGHTIEGLCGSDTAVYVGVMGVEFADNLLKDLDSLPMYFGTGTSRAIISNRISYFFDWHGPSMTIDTACSSSLIAVHQAVQTLRTGESRVAVACGSQVILGPEVFVVESKLKMLSPTGRSRMWDADADGYARGEGLAAVVLKRLSDAIADGDHIECIIRETGANQDGRSSGLTAPSSEAQTALIRRTYTRAGLDPENNPYDRPQFFEAHGTGTQAGDPKEAAAINACFGQQPPYNGHDGRDCLYVGSAKTVIGHTEGAAGLAGLLKASGIIQRGLIPPNLLFNTLNPAVEPYYVGLQITTTPKPWPKLPEGVPRRVSVNSFGFGGSNAHAIVEEYIGPSRTVDEAKAISHANYLLFVFSSASEVSLLAQLRAYSTYLKEYPDINVVDLAWTLQTRRSQLSFRTFFSAKTIDELTRKIDEKLDLIQQDSKNSLAIRSVTKSATVTHLLGVFTGQGAQWPSMGAQLVKSSQFAHERIRSLEESLTTLPQEDRPEWSLLHEMLGHGDTSRQSEAEMSQPLCTALQIILVDILRTAGITFKAVVGHSSGEIAAAYAAGFISDRDALRIAYYRGLHAHLAAHSPSGRVQEGAMLAVATSWEDAHDLINLAQFRGRLAVAAHNSSASVTLSGDKEAILHAKRVFDEERIFNRILRVDKAYHSHHMVPCGEAYVQSLRACHIQVNRERSECLWYSSVHPGGGVIEPGDHLQDFYWRDNMTQPVMFADAIQKAVTSSPQPTLALEIGPHPSLKGPATQVISEVRPTNIGSFPYSGVLQRGMNDAEAFSNALGFVWTHYGAECVNLQAYQNAVLLHLTRQPKLVVDLPYYQWNHNRAYWHESRKSRRMRERKQPPHEILGIPCPNSTTRDLRWTNVLKVSEIDWLEGHRLQGQIVFPASGYVAMALEAARNYSVLVDRSVELFELHDLSIPKAIILEEDANSGVEILITLIVSTHGQSKSTTTAEFSCYSCSSTSGSQKDMELTARSTVRVVFGTPSDEALSCIPLDDFNNMSKFEAERFYSSLSTLGYNYSNNFRGLSSLKRRLNRASVLVNTYPYNDTESAEYVLHPSMLDVAFQACILAYSAPGDGRLWSIHVPTSFGRIRVNPAVCASLPESQTKVPVSASLLDGSEVMSANLDIFDETGHCGMVQVEDLTFSPFAPATESDDRRLFWNMKLDVAAPERASVCPHVSPSQRELELAKACERISYYYLRKWHLDITDEDWTNAQPHFRYLRGSLNHTLSVVSEGKHPCLRREWSKDSDEDTRQLVNRYTDNVDVKLLVASGENMPAAVRGETTILAHLLADNMLSDFYEHGLGFLRYNAALADMVKQAVHRYPHARILEIGAGTGGATKSILEAISSTLLSYTYTDVSVGFFNEAEERFKLFNDRMTFRVLDIEEEPAAQGFEPYSYDIVIASNALHATASLQTTLQNVRQLLKPGAYLFLLEVTHNGPIRFTNMMGGMPGWWLGAEQDSRTFQPTTTPDVWHDALCKAGFGGIDAMTNETDAVAWPFAVMAAQAVDDRVNLLRRPLRSSFSLQKVVVIGARNLQVIRIAEEVAYYLQPFCDQVSILHGLPTQSEAVRLEPMTTFINLADIMSPIFKTMTVDTMDGLKRILEVAKHILWVTVAALTGEPYHSASISFLRAIRHEAAHVGLNHLDIAQEDLDFNNDVAKVIAEHLLRQCALEQWQTSGDGSLLWSKEPEVYLNGGKLMIPRLKPNAAQNDRLNSVKRVVTRRVSLSNSKVSISPPAPVSLYSLPCLEDQDQSVVYGQPEARVRIEASSLMALNVAPNTFLFLGIGKGAASKNVVVVLSARNSNIITPIVSPVVCDTEDQDAACGNAVIPPIKTTDLLVSVSSTLLAQSLAQILSSGSSILVHCSSQDHFLALAISKQALVRGVQVTFTSDESDSIFSEEEFNSTWIKLNSRKPKHIIRKILHSVQPTHFLDLVASTQDLSSTNDLSQCIADVLPEGCKRIDTSDLFRHKQSVPHNYDEDGLRVRLESAVSMAIAERACSDSELIIPVGQIHGPSTKRYSTSVIHWAQDQFVTVQVRPLEALHLFSKHKTYLLVGMTGQIGQSICEWMVKHGAGCVCLASRKPRINESWLRSFRGIVKTFALDITDKSSLASVVGDIRANCPPIMGLINGAMILQDKLFSNMSFDEMEEVLGPKIDGSNNLDDLFHDDKLDFFILLSSLACVVGNSGQSNYAAANGYLGGLARKRRRRGFAASTLDIGRVAGIGYVETAGEAVADQLTRFGFLPISEPELHQMLAEAIHSGYPDPVTDTEGIPEAVLTTGIQTVYDNTEGQIAHNPWIENPFFSHCIVHTPNKSQISIGSREKTSSHCVSEQLLKVTTREEAIDTLQVCLTAKLRIILQISPDQEINRNIPLIEIGIDSFAAVEVRSWFLKELQVDVPVLKVVGGASIAELCERALQRLPEQLFGGGVNEDEARGVTSARATTPSKAQVQSPSYVAQVQPAESESSSESTSCYNPEGSVTGLDHHPDRPITPYTDNSANTCSAEESATGHVHAPTVFLKNQEISFGQSRFWFLRFLLEDPTTFNVSFFYQVAGNLHVGKLERAVRDVVARYEALRTCFVADENEADRAFQRIIAVGDSRLRLEQKSVASLHEAAGEYVKFKSHAFDLENADTMRLLLLTVSSSLSYLLINYHHMVMDGVSFHVFLSDLEKSYKGQSLGTLVPTQFPDFSAAQREAFQKGEMDAELKYWKEMFPAGKQPPVLPLLPMAHTHSRMPMTSFDVHQVTCRVEPHLAVRLKSVAKKSHCTPFHVYLAAFKVMLFRFIDQIRPIENQVDELTIGIADANRHDGNTMSSIGFFLNLLTLRFQRQGGQKFADAVIEARKTTYTALENSRLPFDVLLKELNATRSSSHSPFFQAFFDYRQGGQEKHAWGNCQFEVQEWHPGRTAYDITLDVTEGTDSLVTFRTQSSLYDQTAAKLLLETYIHVLDTLSSNPSLVLADTPLFSKKQLDNAIDLGRGPNLTSEWPETIPHRIDQVAQNNQNKVAIMDGIGNVLTYSAMIDRVKTISETLQNAKLGIGSAVLVFQQAASDWVCSMLAILRIGAIYVPLDLRNPMPRLAVIAGDCKPSAVLADDTTLDLVVQLQVPATPVINVSRLTEGPSTNVSVCATAESAAAILYTSGSTGKPKGIIVSHRGLRNEIEGYTKMWKLGAEHVLQQSAFTFNHSLDQIFTGLVNGGMVYVVPGSSRGDPVEITEIIHTHDITYTKATPSEYSLWMQYGGENLRQAYEWRSAFAGGELLTSAVIRDFAELALPNLHLFNSYGPTEISISSTKMEVDYRGTSHETATRNNRIPCGYSLPNYTTYIVDSQLNPLPAGMPGEVCIGGAGISLGYLNNTNLTTKHFVPDPFVSPQHKAAGWTLMYRTGDIGHMREDGAMVFHNRMEYDTQIKIRGLRIELGDIESNIVAASDGVLRQAVVTLHGQEDNIYLVAHVVFASVQKQSDANNSPAENVDRKVFLETLLQRLPVPQYMVPVAAIPIDRIPLNNHSKADRMALQDMALPPRHVPWVLGNGFEAVGQGEEEGELTATIAELRRLWLEVLEDHDSPVFDNRLTPSTDFFRVGGNSLLVLRLQSNIRRSFQVSIRLVELLGASTLRQMAQKIRESSSLEHIQWEEEAALPAVPSFLNLGHKNTQALKEKKRNGVILVTGATGFLTGHILSILATSPGIEQIHCVAMRESSHPPMGPIRKITYDRGDLAAPLLGLSKDRFISLSSRVNTILHFGAAGSSWDDYFALRPSNVQPTKELVKMAAHRRIPIHYISTVGTLPSPETTIGSRQIFQVPDRWNGYVATRWVSERILESAAEALEIPVHIYRFIPSAHENEHKHIVAKQAVWDEFIRCIDAAGSRPDLRDWDGWLDMIPVAQAARWISESVLISNALSTEAMNSDCDRKVRFWSYEGSISVNVAELREYIREQRGEEDIPPIPVPKWIKLSKKLGFSYIFASYHVSVGKNAQSLEGHKARQHLLHR